VTGKFLLFLIKKNEFHPDFRRPNVKRLLSLNESVKRNCRVTLTWPDIVSELLIDPDKRREGASNNDVFQTEPKTTKKNANKNKHPSSLEAMTVKQLKDLLKSIDQTLSTTGKKSVLIERIVKARPIPPSVNVSPAEQSINLTPVRVTKSSLKAKPVSTRKAVKPKPSSRIVTITQSRLKRKIDKPKGSARSKRARRELDELNKETDRIVRRMNKK